MKALRWMVPLALVLAGVLPAGMASGQEFPSRLIKIIVPYPPGGGVDGLARPIAERLGRLWSQSVIIENKPGAATMIGGAEVAHAPADGTYAAVHQRFLPHQQSASAQEDVV